MEFKIGDRVTIKGDTNPIGIINGIDEIYCYVGWDNGSEGLFFDTSLALLPRKRLKEELIPEDYEKCINYDIDEELETFKKFDNDKPRPDLLHPEFLLEMSKLLAFGAKKYDDENWKKCEDYNRYYAAAMRHLLEWKSGEITDKDSNSNHLINASVNLMFLYHLSTKK